jgi:hypothetical protein
MSARLGRAVTSLLDWIIRGAWPLQDLKEVGKQEEGGKTLKH